MRAPDGYQRPPQARASEVAGYHAGRLVRRTVGGGFGLIWRYPLVIALVMVGLFLLTRGLVGWIIACLVVVGLVVGGRYEPRVGHVLSSVWGWQANRHHAHYDRRSSAELAAELGLTDRDGTPFEVMVVRDPTGALIGLDIVAPMSDQEIQGRLGVWQAQLQLPPGYVLILRDGQHRGHRRVEVVAPKPPLPEQCQIADLGDFRTGLVLGLMDGGEYWRWDVNANPHLLVSGATGSGKTVFDVRLVRSWLAAGGHVALLDYGKGTAFPDLEGTTGVRRAVSKPDCEALLSDVRAEMDERYEQWQADRSLSFTPTLVVFEEAFVAIESMSGRDDEAREDQRLSSALRDSSTRIALLGRECGTFLCLSCQRGDAQTMGGATRDQLTTRICLLANAKDATVSMSLEVSRDALVAGMEPPVRIRDLPSPQGRALVEDRTGVHLVQVSL